MRGDEGALRGGQRSDHRLAVPASSRDRARGLHPRPTPRAKARSASGTATTATAAAEPLITIDGLYYRNQPILTVRREQAVRTRHLFERASCAPRSSSASSRGRAFPTCAAWAASSRRRHRTVRGRLDQAALLRPFEPVADALASCNPAWYIGRLVASSTTTSTDRYPRRDLGDPDPGRPGAVGRHHHPHALGPARPGAAARRQALQLAPA